MAANDSMLPRTAAEAWNSTSHGREFAQKSVDQAEKAITSLMDSASKSLTLVPSMNDVPKQALAITEKNLKASLEHAGILMHAKDMAGIGDLIWLLVIIILSSPQGLIKHLSSDPENSPHRRQR